MNLSLLLECLEEKKVVNQSPKNITDIYYNSMHAKDGGLFFAIQGFNEDGHRFIYDAYNNGSVAAIGEKQIEVPKGLTYVMVPDSRAAMAKVSALFYDYPSRKLKVIGVTGTNGKTTTTHLIESILREASFSVGVIGTINYRFLNQEYSSTRTTPEAIDLNKMLHEMANVSVDYAILEVSSHSMDLQRVTGIDFIGGVFTNLSEEHLDYHKTMEHYFDCKKRFFTETLTHSWYNETFCAINLDDEYGERLIDDVTHMYCMPFGEKAHARVRPEVVKLSLNGIHSEISTPSGTIHVNSPLIGKLNLYNIMAAISVGISLKIPLKVIEKGISKVKSVRGRLEYIRNSLGIKVLIDYAHSPDALQKVLSDLKAQTKGSLITVFGCGGDRDRQKRSKMGDIATHYSDLTILTSDNPRSEEPIKIIEEIEAGIPRHLEKYKLEKDVFRKDRKGYATIPDRKEAIEKALHLAGRGDLVLLAGKGHEDYQIFSDKTIHFDDREVTLNIIQKRSKEIA